MLTSVTFILLLCYSAVLCNPHGVFWTIVDKHVTIGHDLNLYCNESSLAANNCCTKHSTRRWFGGPDRKLLYRNGISFYPSKYTTHLEDGGFYLTIHDVEEKDLNVFYACSVAIYEYTNILLPNYDTAESSFSTEISTSTEPSISGQRKGNTNERNDELTFLVIIITTFLVPFIVVYIVGSNKRVKKLLMGIFRSNNASTTSENGKENINMESVHSNDTSTTLQNGTEDINMESACLIEDVTTTKKTDQKNLVEPVHSNDASTTLQNGTEDINMESEPLIEVVTTTENTDQKNLVEPVHSNDASTTLQNGTEDINMESGKLIEDQTKTENSDQKIFKEAQYCSGGGVKNKSKSHVDQDQYTFNSGIAVIINNVEFDSILKLPDRAGSDIDVSSLFQRFQELGFDVDVLNDASEEDITEKFNEIKENKKALKDTDCLFVVLLTYGNEDHVFATERSIKIKTLMDNFSAENCPELILKPKVFIFQACKGGELSRGVNVRVVRDKNQADAGGEFMEYDEIHGEMIRIPNEEDFLVIYVTSSGYGAFRNTEKGSPFVRRLSEELHNMRKGENFYNVFTRVNRKACKGGELGRGVNVRVVRDKNQADAGVEFTEYDEIHGEMIRIPNEADVLAIYSTSSGYGAFRNTEKGSPFVRHLSEELHNMRKGENFYNVLTRVNRKFQVMLTSVTFFLLLYYSAVLCNPHRGQINKKSSTCM